MLVQIRSQFVLSNFPDKSKFDVKLGFIGELKKLVTVSTDSRGRLSLRVCELFFIQL